MNRMQKIFDTCATHLLKQKAQSRLFLADGTRSMCMYFGPDGLRCGASPILRDELKDDKDFLSQYNSVGFGEVPQIYLKSEFTNLSHEELLVVNELQNIHDCNEPLVWPSKLIELANKLNLTFVPSRVFGE